MVEPPPKTILMMFPGHDGLAHHEAVDELLQTVSEEVVLSDGDVLLQVEDGVGRPGREVERVARPLEELTDSPAVPRPPSQLGQEVTEPGLH